MLALNKARDLVQEKRAEATTGATKVGALRENRLRDAEYIRQEAHRN